MIVSRSLSRSCRTRCWAASLACSSLGPAIDPERSITSARLTGARSAPGTSWPVKSTVRNTSDWPAVRYGWDSRVSIFNEPSWLTVGGIGRGSSTVTGLGSGGRGAGGSPWTRGRPITTASRARAPAVAKNAVVLFMERWNGPPLKTIYLPAVRGVAAGAEVRGAGVGEVLGALLPAVLATDRRQGLRV